MLKVGITGGIGSGKSLISKIFEVLGIPVYYADNRAKQILETSEDVRQAIVSIFGEEAYTGQRPDRAYLAKAVFADPSLREKLNNIVHPAVQSDFIAWTGEKKSSPYILKEAAISFETGAYRQMDKMILVRAPKELRLKRVVLRDEVGEEDVLRRMQAQWEDDKKEALSHYIIDNNGEEAVLPKVLQIHNELVALSEKKAD